MTTKPVNGIPQPLQDIGPRQAPAFRETPAASVPAPKQASLGETRSPGTDRVELSDAARTLAEPGAAGGSGSQVEPERLRAVLERLANGHYDSAEARDAIVRKLVADLGG